MIKSLRREIEVFDSKDKPKKIVFEGSDGKFYTFLLKHEKQEDFRKEKRIVDFSKLFNVMLAQDAEARQRNLNIRTNAIVPLDNKCGLIEWYSNTDTIYSIVTKENLLNNIEINVQTVGNTVINWESVK